jgi:hypothetical protein
VVDVVLGLVLVVALYAALLLVVFVADEIRTAYDLRDRGARTTGVVVDTRTERHQDPVTTPGGPVTYTTSHHATVTFDTGTWHGVLEIDGEYRKGDTVPIVYDPDNPDVAVPAAGTSTRARWGRVVVLAGAAVGIVAGLVRVARRIRYG